MLARAVVNAGPLVALSLAGRLDLLPALFKEFWIPETVFPEVTLAGLGRPRATALGDTAWAERVRSAPEPDPLLVAELDPGEAAVISLARANNPCLAIIDEKSARARNSHRSAAHFTSPKKNAAFSRVPCCESPARAVWPSS